MIIPSVMLPITDGVLCACTWRAVDPASGVPQRTSMFLRQCTVTLLTSCSIPPPSPLLPPFSSTLMANLRATLVKDRAKRKRSTRDQARVAMGTAFSVASTISGPPSVNGAGSSSVTLPPAALPSVSYEVLPSTVWDPGDVVPPLEEYGGVQVVTTDAQTVNTKVSLSLSVIE
jgi:hypothetical protein